MKRRSVLFPTNDADLVFLDRHRGHLEDTFILAVPPRDMLQIVMNKAHLAALADAHGLATPVTRRVTSLDDLEAIAEDLIYPAVIKPLNTYDWRTPAFSGRFGIKKGWRVRDHEECRAIYSQIAPLAPEALVQEWIEGPESAYHVVGAVTGEGGQPLAAFTGRKLMQYPPGVGLGCLLQAVNDDRLAEQGLTFLASIGYRGICEIEVKKDARSGRHRLVEINPRPWDQHDLARRLGVDLIWIYYRDLVGLPPEPFVRPTRSATWIRLGGVIGTLKEGLRTGNSSMLAVVGRCLFAKKSYAIWDWQDPGPTLRHFRNMMKKL
ncbi:MAG: hypothetical protein EA405_02930 [Rhodospirillales bacterium]|nr:MAG: hypothetical protein EA405_02930 [Rhodospirillales bacterium]